VISTFLTNGTENVEQGAAASATLSQPNKAESFMKPQKGYRWRKSCYYLYKR